MSTIRAVYVGQAPNFPATDQHPDAVRYAIGALFIDAIGGQPTQAEIDAVFGQDAASLARQARIATDTTERQALVQTPVLVTFINMSPAQIDAWCAANVTSLATARDALALLAKIVNVAIRSQVR